MPKPCLGFAPSASPPGKGEFSNDWKNCREAAKDTKVTSDKMRRALRADHCGKTDGKAEGMSPSRTGTLGERISGDNSDNS